MDTVTKPACEAVNTTLTRGDLFFFSWHFYARFWGIKLPFLIGSVHFIWMLQHGEDQTIQGIGAIFLYIFFAIVWIVPWALTVALVSIANALLTFGVPGVLGAHYYEIRDDGFFESTSANDTLVRWNAVRQVSRTKRHILVKLSWYQFHVIPFRAFASAAEADSFYRELQTFTTAGSKPDVCKQQSR